MDHATKAFAALFVISIYNILLGALMINRFIPVMTGMALSFTGMGIITGVSAMVLIPGEKPWRRPKRRVIEMEKDYDKELMAEADYWNERFRKDGLGCLSSGSTCRT